MQIWAEPEKLALPICNYSQILYQFLMFTQNLKRSLKMLMCCIIDIQPNDLPEFLSATLHYTNHFTDCQTNNTKYFKFFHNHHNLFISTVLK